MNDYKKILTSLNLKSKPIFDIEDHLKYTKDWRGQYIGCLLYTSPSPRDTILSRMPSSA